MNVGTAHSEVNPNTRVMNSRGIWLSYVLAIGLLHVVLLSIPFVSVPVVWTLTNLIHNMVRAHPGRVRCSLVGLGSGTGPPDVGHTCHRSPDLISASLRLLGSSRVHSEKRTGGGGLWTWREGHWELNQGLQRVPRHPAWHRNGPLPSPDLGHLPPWPLCSLSPCSIACTQAGPVACPQLAGPAKLLLGQRGISAAKFSPCLIPMPGLPSHPVDPLLLLPGSQLLRPDLQPAAPCPSEGGST